MRTTISALAALLFFTATRSVYGFAQNRPPSAGTRQRSSAGGTPLRQHMAATHVGTSEDEDATTALSMRRRQFVARHAGVMMATLLVGSSPSVADDKIDYTYLQDLLGAPDASSAPKTQTYVPKGSRPTYLVDPTEEFKANEAKAMDFKRGQLERKKAFLSVLEKFETDPNDEKLLADGLDDMRRQVRSQNGLPLGVTKDDLVKRIRRRKAKRYWTTDIEIAYQDLLQEIRYQQSPNTEKDRDNPF